MECCLLSCDIDDYPMWRNVFERVNSEPVEWLIGRARQYFAPLAASSQARKITPVTLSEGIKNRRFNAAEYWTDLAHGAFPCGDAQFTDPARFAVGFLASKYLPSEIMATNKDWHQQSPVGSGLHHGAIVASRWFVSESELSDEQVLAALSLALVFDLLEQHATAIAHVIVHYQKTNPDDVDGRDVDESTLDSLAALHARAQQAAIERVAKAEELLEACEMCSVWRRNAKSLASIGNMAKTKKIDETTRHEWLCAARKIASDRPLLRERKNKSRIAKLISADHYETIRKLDDDFWGQVW